MPDLMTIYLLTLVVFGFPWPILWYTRGLTILRAVLLLFAADTTLTVEAAFFSDIVSIAVLHVVTVPTFFILIYIDLLKQNKTQFACFLCEKQIEIEDNFEVTRRIVEGREVKIAVHRSCVSPSEKERKPISERMFRRGIPK